MDKLLSVYAKEIYNEALEEAAKIAEKYESYGAAYEIRTLKKHSSVGMSKELDAAITEEINNPPTSIMKEE